MAGHVPTKTFREFPPEVREMIFIECMKLPPAGFTHEMHKGPSILAALRGDPVLYTEALHSYYKHNQTCVTLLKFRTFSHNLGATALRSIRQLRFNFNQAGESSLSCWHVRSNKFAKFLLDDYSRLVLASDTETVTIDIRSDGNILAVPYIAKLAKFFLKLRRVEIARRRSRLGDSSDMMKSTLVLSIDTIFPGVKGKHTQYNDYTKADHVVWEREGGGVLKPLKQERREGNDGGKDEESLVLNGISSMSMS